MQSGASGAKNKTDKSKRVHANLYYEEVRNREPFSDANKISANVPEFTAQEVEEIRLHLFVNEQPRNGGMIRFDPDYEQSIVWQRLIEGKKIKKSDIIFLKHERKELTIMKELGYNYERAHVIANEEFNWYKSREEDK